MEDCFSRFLYCKNGIKSRNASQISKYHCCLFFANHFHFSRILLAFQGVGGGGGGGILQMTILEIILNGLIFADRKLCNTSRGLYFTENAKTREICQQWPAQKLILLRYVYHF